MRSRACALSLAALLVFPDASAAQSAPPVAMKEWKVPWEKSRPRDPYVDPSGNVWFVGQAGNYVARLDPQTGEFTRFAIDSGTFPHTVVVDPKGYAWYAGNRNAMIGRIDPRTGQITRYRMPDSSARDPHTIAFDQKGNLWFTLQGANQVGRLDPVSGKIDLVRMTEPRSRPYGIVVDSKGHPWFDLFGTNRIGTIDPGTLSLKTFPLPEGARPRRIAITSDDVIWYGDYMRGYLGRLDPRSGAVQEWPAPGGKLALIYGMASDDRDRIWFVETGVQPNRLVGFDPKKQEFFASTPIESGGGTVRHMFFDRKTGLLWFGTDNNTIGRAVVSPKPVM
jgi:virginiamycin B lyase